MFRNPFLYEINTRVWLNRFRSNSGEFNLLDVPEDYWKSLSEFGIEIVWLMGIWETPQHLAEKYCLSEELTKEYNRALKDWNTVDVIGSPFAIEDYKIAPSFGSSDQVIQLKNNLNKNGMKLILDFIPNHFHVESSLVQSLPGLFVRGTEENLKIDPYTFFRSGSKIFAHGRDPFFPAWQDTVQINYFSETARDFMTNRLCEVASICDGVRCDMAMLSLTNVFQNTWGKVINVHGNSCPTTEFWKDAISTVKKINAGFIFIAEAYWDLEWQLQKLGFDFTYDKSLTDRLKTGNTYLIKDHLMADKEYQKKSVRFLENHDEPRAISMFGKIKSKAALIIISTIPGMKFYHDGQFEGKKIKLPVQLGRQPREKPDEDLLNYYKKVLNIASKKIFKEGEWMLLETLPAWEGNQTYKNILSWQWKHKDETKIICVNYSDTVSSCRIKFDAEGYPEEIMLSDLLNDAVYHRSAEEIYRDGLYVELRNYQSHIFSL